MDNSRSNKLLIFTYLKQRWKQRELWENTLSKRVLTPADDKAKEAGSISVTNRDWNMCIDDSANDTETTLSWPAFHCSSLQWLLWDKILLLYLWNIIQWSHPRCDIGLGMSLLESLFIADRGWRSRIASLTLTLQTSIYMKDNSLYIKTLETLFKPTIIVRVTHRRLLHGEYSTFLLGWVINGTVNHSWSTSAPAIKCPLSHDAGV